jgi:hypothetical protein
VGICQIKWLVRHEIGRTIRVFLATWELAGEKHTACAIQHLAYNCDTRARRRTYRNSLCHQLCVLGPIWSIYPACGSGAAHGAVA